MCKNFYSGDKGTMSIAFEGRRGGKHKSRNDISQVFINADGKYEIRMAAIMHALGHCTRLSETIFTISRQGEMIFQGTVADLVKELSA